MSLKHNKKRNVGLTREFFTKFIAEATVNKKNTDIEQAKNIWKKYFSRGTELNKEFNLFKALYETSLSNKEVAINFIVKIKEAAKIINQEKLNNEKTSLIREVNNSLKDTLFFERQIEDYSNFATIQICLDYWASNKLQENIINPAIIELEDKLLNQLIKQKEIKIFSKETIKEDVQIDKLVFKIMLEKYNKKFIDSLTETQQKLVKYFAFYNSMENKKHLGNELKTIHTKTLNLIDKELNENKKMPALQKQKFESIKDILKENKIDFDKNVDEDTIIFYMGVSKLYDEFLGE